MWALSGRVKPEDEWKFWDFFKNKDMANKWAENTLKAGWILARVLVPPDGPELRKSA